MRPKSGEHALALAVIEDALARLAGANPERDEAPVVRRHAREARAWIESRSTETFSFEWCCDAVGISPSYMRRGIREGRVTHATVARAARQDRENARPLLARGKA
jgi:hypothetical protein